MVASDAQGAPACPDEATCSPTSTAIGTAVMIRDSISRLLLHYQSFTLAAVNSHHESFRRILLVLSAATGHIATRYGCATIPEGFGPLLSTALVPT